MGIENVCDEMDEFAFKTNCSTSTSAELNKLTLTSTDPDANSGYEEVHEIVTSLHGYHVLITVSEIFNGLSFATIGSVLETD